MPRATLIRAARFTSNQLGPCRILRADALMKEPSFSGWVGRGLRPPGGAAPRTPPGLCPAARLGFWGRLGLGGPAPRPLLCVVVDVKPAPLEYYAGAAPDQALEGRLGAFRAFPQRLVPHRLEFLEMVAAS